MFKKTLYIILMALALTGCTTATVSGKPSMGMDEKEKLLRQRVAENWQAMIDRDMGKMYDLYDPFFRSRTARAWFIGQEMPIYYHSFEIAGVDIKGNVAKVETKIVYSIKHMGTLGREIKKDNTEGVVKDTWLFIDNNWQRQFYDNITDGTFAYY